jgi:hypothetical protein
MKLRTPSEAEDDFLKSAGFGHPGKPGQAAGE